jgi:hypothetical protein
MSKSVKEFKACKSFLTLHIQRIELHVEYLKNKLFVLQKNGNQFHSSYYSLKNRLNNSNEVLNQLKVQENDNK